MKTLGMKRTWILALGLVTLSLIARAQPRAVCQWWAAYDSPDHLMDVPMAPAFDIRNNVYVTGYSVRVGLPGYPRKVTTLRYSPSGQQTFYERYDSTGQGSEFGDAIAVDDSGAAYVACVSYPTSTSSEELLLKYTPEGAIAWVNHYPLYPLGCRIVLEEGGSIVLGISCDEGIAIWKLDPNGKAADSVVISRDTAQITLLSLLPATGGELYVIGERLYGIYEPGGGMPIQVEWGEMLKLDSHCRVVWRQNLGEFGGKARFDRQGNLVCENGRTLAKYSKDGNLRWSKNLPACFSLTDFVIDSHNNIDVSSNYSCDSTASRVMQYDADGNLQWGATIDAGQGYTPQSFALALDSADHVYVTGVIGGPGYVRCCTEKLDSGGRPVWNTQFHESLDDEGFYLYVGDSGNVYVGGRSGSSIYDPNFLVIKYSQTPADNVVESTGGVPVVCELSQNFPNPFNPKTVISGQWTVDSRVRLAVFDLLGREIAVLADARYPAGRYSFTFDGSGLASGIYFYRLIAGSFSAIRKMTLVR